MTYPAKTFITNYTPNSYGSLIAYEPRLIHKQLPNTDLVAVVYDSSSAESFAACYRWLEAVRKFNPGKPLTGKQTPGALTRG